MVRGHSSLLKHNREDRAAENRDHKGGFHDIEPHALDVQPGEHYDNGQAQRERNYQLRISTLVDRVQFAVDDT